ncbi:MAG: translocation/assembly module TamB, partial [Muribaculaceae bacterium]|nr:translocation/assembly module TamB [Muribaculaceae bacterium]
AYNLKFEIAVTRDASLNLIMDPVADDRIQAKGNGIIKLTYDSADEDFGITGKYVIDQGKYHFTLQDIIVRDFNILKGGSITFRGDPYAAQLDMSASYSTHANLTDLDPSFALDKDINRRNVMVNAILRLTGDIRQPEIEYDFAFPNSSEDVYRRVMSIIGSTDMKYRQIMYLLALQRFYTPEYMASTRSNNELISVASSTVSSQISNMLGALSENWSVAPNLRSEKGDFSDIEVDVALSSRLLNNRLIFNGNFGYRDQSMNTNQFVGDFDIEYLLNPRGTWRLKAYNRYNDQNYYIRSATTTQGIGIMYTRDFDNMFGFLRRKKRQQQPIVIDSISSGSDEETSGSVPDQP